MADQNVTQMAGAGRPKNTTCLDCEVLPPFSIRLCALHAAAEDMLAALRDLVDATTAVYQTGRIAAEPFVAARNVIANATGA